MNKKILIAAAAAIAGGVYWCFLKSRATMANSNTQAPTASFAMNNNNAIAAQKQLDEAREFAKSLGNWNG
jgi:hypothetical protein